MQGQQQQQKAERQWWEPRPTPRRGQWRGGRRGGRRREVVAKGMVLMPWVALACPVDSSERGSGE